MLKLAISCVLVVYITAHPVLDGSRIVNGTEAKLGEIPYIVSIGVLGEHYCGGSILDNKHILTAAHCLTDVNPNTFTVQYGQLNVLSPENIIEIAEIYIPIHEDYAPWNNYANDIGVLKLDEDIVFSKNVQPVKLPEQDEKPPGGNVAQIAGWGQYMTGGDFPDCLQKVDIILYTDENCQAALGSTVDSRYHICAGVPEGGKGVCNGDSGGPLTANGKQWGVTSWSLRPCSNAGPAVYARVPSYINWIKAKQVL